MKRTLVVILATFFVAAGTFAQKISFDKVPVNVKAKFTALYPKITKTNWELENGNYEAEFDFDKVETTVVINPAGELVQTEIEIGYSALPKWSGRIC